MRKQERERDLTSTPTVSIYSTIRHHRAPHPSRSLSRFGKSLPMPRGEHAKQTIFSKIQFAARQSSNLPRPPWRPQASPSGGNRHGDPGGPRTATAGFEGRSVLHLTRWVVCVVCWRPLAGRLGD